MSGQIPLMLVGQRLDSLAKLGVSARLDGDVIRFGGNTAALTPEVVAEVRANKPAFMAEIQRRAAALERLTPEQRQYFDFLTMTADVVVSVALGIAGKPAAFKSMERTESQ